jgi:hypothetical protein
MTYLLGWSVIPQILVRRERWPGGYKTKGIPLVYPGQDVLPDQPVIRLEKAQPIENLATIPRLSLPGVIDLPDSASLNNGDVRSNRQLAGETLPAGLRGRVVDITRRGGVIIESCAAVLQGAIGAGNQVAGVLTMWQASDAGQQAIPPGALLVIPGPLNFAMLRQAMISGVVGVIASSISSRDFEGFLRTDLVELIDSVDIELAQAHLPQMTVLLTEGLGTIAMPVRTINLLSHHQGSIALLSGATSVRQGIFPELVVSLQAKEIRQNWQLVQPDPTLMLGAQVRVCSGEYEGVIGTVDYLYSHQQVFASGIRARAARLRLEDGSMLSIPLTLVERIS